MGGKSKTRRGEELKKKCNQRLIKMPEGIGDRLVEHCSKGLSIKTFCFIEKISFETLQEFRRTDETFANRYKEAKLALHFNCEKQLNEIIDSQRDPRAFNALRFKMQNLIHWSDKTETKSKQTIEQSTKITFDTSSLTEEQLDEEIKKLEENS